MKHLQNLKLLLLIIVLVLVLVLFVASCSDSEKSNNAKIREEKTVIKLIKGASWATVLDKDGISSIVSEQRIPRGNGVDVYDVDFKFNDKGSTSYDIFIDGMFEKEGTVIHVDVTDMRRNTTNLYIRKTLQGHQVGYYREQ